MQRRQWTSEKKVMIVLSGLRGQSVASICNEHGISQSQYYQWKDQFLANACKAFDVEKVSTKQARLECENQKLKGLVGELTLELKKSEGGVMRKRGSYPAVEARNAPFVERICQLKSDHPFWGYRRVWAHMTNVGGLKISKHHVEQLMKQHDLQVKKNMKLKAICCADTKKPKPSRPNQWWGIDMTKVMVEGFGWVYVVIVIDWYTKKVVGHYAGLQSKSWHWLIALNKAVNRQFTEGARRHNLHLMSDNGCQPTATSFMAACHALGIQQAFTSYNNPKGNADTERFMLTLKEEFVWLREWTSPTAFIDALDKWIEHYNAAYLHSTLGYIPPSTFEHRFLTHNNQQGTPLKHAC